MRLANYIRRKLEGDAKLAMLGVEGEISNLRVQASGNRNFDVKDRDAVLNCFAFPSDAATFPAAKNGDAIVVLRQGLDLREEQQVPARRSARRTRGRRRAPRAL